MFFKLQITLVHKKTTPGLYHAESGPTFHPGQEALDGQHPGLCPREMLLALTLAGSTSEGSVHSLSFPASSLRLMETTLLQKGRPVWE